MSLKVPSFILRLGMATNRPVFPLMTRRSLIRNTLSIVIVAYALSLSSLGTGNTRTSVISMALPPVVPGRRSDAHLPGPHNGRDGPPTHKANGGSVRAAAG